MELILDMSDARQKQTLLTHVRSLQGMHRFEVVRYRPRRSDAQNAYLWGVVYPLIGDTVRACGNDDTSDDDVHLMLRAKFLRRTVVNRQTGEAMGVVVGSTADLDTAAFSDYVEKCRQWAAEMLDLEIPDPDPAYLPRPRGHAAAGA